MRDSRTRSSDLGGWCPVLAQHEIKVDTAAALETSDITPDVQRLVEESRVLAGFALVHCLHTSAGLLLNEFESGFRRDLAELADRLVPADAQYRHDDMSVRCENLCPEDVDFPNGHSHLQHALLGTPTIIVPISERSLVLGRWQRILLVEYDRPRARRISVNLFGVSSTPGEERDDEGRQVASPRETAGQAPPSHAPHAAVVR